MGVRPVQQVTHSTPKQETKVIPVLPNTASEGVQGPPSVQGYAEQTSLTAARTREQSRRAGYGRAAGHNAPRTHCGDGGEDASVLCERPDALLLIQLKHEAALDEVLDLRRSSRAARVGSTGKRQEGHVEEGMLP